MSGARFYQVELLLLLWTAVLLAAAYLFAVHRRRQTRQRFAEAGLLEKLNPGANPARRFWKAAAVLAATVFIVLALSRPAWNPKPRTVKRQGRDVVFVLDISRSMLAEDLAPNRIERAKLAIRDCLEALEGDRVGLVAFAGTAVVKCPLTLDYGFFRMMLENLSPGDVSRGGTLIGGALRRCMEDIFDEQDQRFRDLILITDGEDHESFPVEAAQQAGEKGIRLIAIGLGDEDQGRRIPVTDENGRRTFLTYKGQEVWTRLDADTLREMAASTPGGRYLNVATGAFDLGAIYRDLVASAEKKALEARTVTRYEEKFQVFLALAFALLVMEALIGERRKASA
jgi:Ca-activated chloride channel homolog